ncbi:bifunctional TRAF-like/MATH-TRAF domain [Babesia duncani]|uniref:Bifunctional TRAF-like/MATH-TRAF domain n=1 Tax=Babesia duncani TaxID=323732 RepID=A0AAD9PM14_9APIC|nr:bifunctional TRAF-like/MATH-TRAF domain [Babesia duncani]
MITSDKEGSHSCMRYNPHSGDQSSHSEDFPSDSSHQDSFDQDYYYQDDPRCPCYMCTNGIDSKSNYSDDDSSAGVEFAVRNFWRLAKTQNDVESPMEGHCRGFHYKLLLHPRGTAGTDSESSHLSVFVEAVVQDWYPEYWVFPNVRFELTVVNFKDPKQSVTSWAHWSFSTDATSRGWQKMISHANLTKAAGFLDNEGTVLIRGKAEPPYPLLWSRDPIYHPPMMWEYIPNRAQREISSEVQCDRKQFVWNRFNRKLLENCHCNDENGECSEGDKSCSCDHDSLPQGDPPYALKNNEMCTCGDDDCNDEKASNEAPEFSDQMCSENCDEVMLQEDPDMALIDDDHESISKMPSLSSNGANTTLLKFLDSLIPCIQPTLDAHLVAIMTHILYHIREFRKQIFMWVPPEDTEKKQNMDGNIIVALQKTFAYMQLYPLAAACKVFKHSNNKDPAISKYYLYEFLPKMPVVKRSWLNQHFNDSNDGCNDKIEAKCCMFDGGRFEWELQNCATSQGTQYQSNGNIITRRKHIEPYSSTSYTLVPGTLSFNIGQRPDIFDKILPQPPNLKLLLKAMRMTDLQVLDVHDQLVKIHSELFTLLLRDLAIAKRDMKRNRILSGHLHPEGVPCCLRDEAELESTCKSLFSGCSETEGLFYNAFVGDISSIYIRCKHSHSLQKALKTTMKNLSKYPEVLFFYLYSAKNAKRGELFDVPLRLDCTNLSEGFGNNDDIPGDPPTLLRKSGNVQDFHRSPPSTSGGVHEANSSEANMPPGRYTFEYSEDEEEDDQEYDDDDPDDTAESSHYQNIDGTKKESMPIKWYSLYALVLKEGDVRGEAVSNDNNFYWLLLRPDEDGPWFRICEGRVERLVTKMEFTEWKCHRDFFCVSAVYIAEDYIDMLQVGEVDLTGCLKTWNPKLFQETLEQLGITEEDILCPSFLNKHAMEICLNNPFAPKSEDAIDPVDPTDDDGGVNLDDPHGEQSDDNFQDVKAPQEKTDPAVLGCSDPCEASVQTQAIFDDLIYSRKIGQRHPRLYASCETHGYTAKMLEAMDERELSGRMIKMASKREIARRINRAETVQPFIHWLFTTSKENTALLNSIKPPANAKQLIKFLQQKERLFEEEFRHLICEIFFKEIGEQMAVQSLYKWPNGQCCQDCGCRQCTSGCPSLLLTENGRYPGEELKTLLAEPATILFRNIQILRCHLEYFCKDCKNLSLQITNEQRCAEISEFKATSERSALFLIECIWDACVRYTQDCRTLLHINSTESQGYNVSNGSAFNNTVGSATGNSSCNINQPYQLSKKPATPPNAGISSSLEQSKDLFVFDGTLSQNADLLEGEIADYFDTKYDLSVHDEIRIMNYLNERYGLPTATEMRKYLRNRQMLVYSLIRPHELATCYLEHCYPHENIKQQLADLGICITWNECAFTKRASLAALSHEERKEFGISSIVIDESVFDIGHSLCDIYENLITKMLLHMQDVDKSLDSVYYDYVYTCADIAKIVDAIQSECSKTLEHVPQDEQIYDKSEQMQTVCTCDTLYTNCRVPLKPHMPCVPDFTIAITPVKNEVKYNLLPQEALPIEDDSDLKPKRKAKIRKQNVEKGACIVPPLDYKLAHVTINQQLACALDERLFPQTSDLVHYSHLNPHISNLIMLGNFSDTAPMINTGHELKSPSHDLNIAIGYAKMLKLCNRESKSVSNPLLKMHDQDKQGSKRIKTAIEIGLITSHDLCGAEGFASEERIIPSRRLMVYNEILQDGKLVSTRVEHLYWALRRILHFQIPGDFDNRFMPQSKTKKQKGVSVRCICGGTCSGDENECAKNLKWRPVPRDAFILYALGPDCNNPIRKGRRRFLFMNPESELGSYVNPFKASDPPRNPNILVLIVGAPASLYNSSIPFPLSDDSEYPLLLFKWMCLDTVDLVMIGAIVCDSKKQLQQYIFEWLLPMVRDMGYLERIGPNEKEEIDSYQVLEECGVRTVHNVRRWSCAIRKINKRTGDIIITQQKNTVDSPPSLKFKEAVAFMRTIRDIAELEALELLPPPANAASENSNEVPQTDQQNQPTSTLAQNQEIENEDVGEATQDSHKLAKKKKKKTPKTAIPANKRSNFSKLLHGNESKLDDDEYDSGSVEPTTSDHNTAHPDPQEQLTSVDLYNLIEDALETMAVYDVIIPTANLHAGVATRPSGGFVLQNYNAKKEWTLDACSYLQDIVLDDISTFENMVPVNLESRQEFCIRQTTTSRSRASIDLLLTFASALEIEKIIATACKGDLFKGAGLAAYLFCALGSVGISKWELDHSTCVESIFGRIATACVEYASYFFIDRESRLYNDVLQSIILILDAIEPLKSKLEKDPNLLFLLGICKSRLQTPLVLTTERTNEMANVGYQQLILEHISPTRNDYRHLEQLCKDVKSPFMSLEHMQQLDDVTIEALYLWWYKRELALVKLQQCIISNGDTCVQLSDINHLKDQILESCAHRFGDDILYEKNGQESRIIPLLLDAHKKNSRSNSKKVSLEILEVLQELQGLHFTNARRAIPNVALAPNEELSASASVYQMRLKTCISSLITMSLSKQSQTACTS